MRRLTIAPRAGWQQKVEQLGLIWHTDGDKPYWAEGTYYSFDRAEIAEIEGATTELYELFVRAGDAIVDDREVMLAFGIPAYAHRAIRDAWEAEPPALNYGRFDLGYDGRSAPKLFEFNCDTPTSLLEAAVVQWDWKEAVFPGLDQFNSLHDRLVGKWADIRTLLPDQHFHFANVADAAGEDSVTTAYLRDTARAAGLESTAILIDEIGWDERRRCFADLSERQMRAVFKLYPWEWLLNERFGEHLIESLDRTYWIEPIWKAMWSNKAVLHLLWAMFPEHPNLLEADRRPIAGDHVRKPIVGREGANVEIVRASSVTAASGGTYGHEGYVHQALYPLPETAPGAFPVIGSWVVDGQPVGMGIREDGLITGNTARFVPHVIEG